jgi:nucleotide-binding universal stress UspA family protein
MIVFAYDGTLNGDWVSHYAVRFAANAPDRRLLLLHVRDGSVPEGDLDARIARIHGEARIFGVSFTAEVIDREGRRVVDRLLAREPPEGVLVCGTRARPRHQALLAGTVSARLLAEARLPVVAIHVKQPGLLGQPGDLLLPLAGHPRGAGQAIPLLRLFGPDLRRLHVLCVSEVAAWRARILTLAGTERWGRGGRAFVARVEREIEEALAPRRFELDASVVVSADAATEIVHAAGRLRSQLIALGASERSLPARLLRTPTEHVLRDAPCDVAVYRSGA